MQRFAPFVAALQETSVHLELTRPPLYAGYTQDLRTPVCKIPLDMEPSALQVLRIFLSMLSASLITVFSIVFILVFSAVFSVKVSVHAVLLEHHPFVETDPIKPYLILCLSLA